jgi:parvulin-like peptidyl-prolyl isomerase
MRSQHLAFLCSLLLVCCGGEPTHGSDGSAATDPVAAMKQAVALLNQRAEHGAESVKVQHVLIAFQGAPRIQGVTRSLAEAEKLAAEVLARALAGEDFQALMRAHSNDTGGGTYTMTKASRRDMVPAFGNVGWRLQVGEVGVAPHDGTTSPYGWHVIKRIE